MASAFLSSLLDFAAEGLAAAPLAFLGKDGDALVPEDVPLLEEELPEPEELPLLLEDPEEDPLLLIFLVEGSFAMTA